MAESGFHSPGQRTADAIVEESLRAAREVARERLGGKKTSGVSLPAVTLTLVSLNFLLCREAAEGRQEGEVEEEEEEERRM